METKEKVEPKIKHKDSSGICSSYDDDCRDVPCPFTCWRGSWNTDGVADGLCPLIHTEN